MMMLSKILSLQESHGKEGELMTGHQLEIKPCSKDCSNTFHCSYPSIPSWIAGCQRSMSTTLIFWGLKLELGNSRIFKIHPKKHMLTIHTSFTLQGCLRNSLPTSGSPNGTRSQPVVPSPIEKQLRDFLQQTSSTWGKTHLVGG